MQQEKVIRLCELASNEHDPKKLRGLIQEISKILEAKEQRSKDKAPDGYQS